MVPTEARLFSAFHTVLCSGHLSQIIGGALYWCPAFGRHSVDIWRSFRGQESVGQFRRISYIKKWLLRLMAQSFLLHARHWSFLRPTFSDLSVWHCGSWCFRWLHRIYYHTSMTNLCIHFSQFLSLTCSWWIARSLSLHLSRYPQTCQC